jgi:hypothetical protein
MRAALERRREEARQRAEVAAAASHRKAAWLWSRSRPIRGSIGEVYLREVRSITAALPPTLRFLPAHDGYAPTMIAALGLPHEISADHVAIDGMAISAVHLTKLQPDGSGKSDADGKAKIVVGRHVAAPIWLAPLTDSLALVITEGVEEGLTLHQVSGLGAWAAGSAARLPLIADCVPPYVETVSIVMDDDADNAGRRNCHKLADRLHHRGIATRLLV